MNGLIVDTTATLFLIQYEFDADKRGRGIKREPEEDDEEEDRRDSGNYGSPSPHMASQSSPTECRDEESELMTGPAIANSTV